MAFSTLCSGRIVPVEMMARRVVSGWQVATGTEEIALLLQSDVVRIMTIRAPHTGPVYLTL
jgi:hypothetical protein